MQVGDHVIGRMHGLTGILTLNDEGYTVVGKYRDGTRFKTLEKPLAEVALDWRKLGEGENGNTRVQGYGVNVTFDSTELSSEVRERIIDGLESLFAEYENVLIGIKPITDEEETE